MYASVFWTSTLISDVSWDPILLHTHSSMVKPSEDDRVRLLSLIGTDQFSTVEKVKFSWQLNCSLSINPEKHSQDTLKRCQISWGWVENSAQGKSSLFSGEGKDQKTKPLSVTLYRYKVYLVLQFLFGLAAVSNSVMDHIKWIYLPETGIDELPMLQ